MEMIKTGSIVIDDLESKLANEEVNIDSPKYVANCSPSLKSLLKELNEEKISEDEFCSCVTPEMYVENGLKSENNITRWHDIDYDGMGNSESYFSKYEPFSNITGLYKVTVSHSWSFPTMEYDGEEYHGTWQGTDSFVVYHGLDGKVLSESLQTEYTEVETVVRGKLNIEAIDNEPLTEILPFMENESKFLNKGGYAVLNALAKHFCLTDKENPFVVENHIGVNIGFESTEFNFGEASRRVNNIGEFVKITGRATRPWAKDKKAVMTIEFALTEDNCKHLAEMLSSKFFKDKFQVSDDKEFINVYGKPQVKNIDYSALFNKESKEKGIKK